MPLHKLLYGLAFSILHEEREAADCVQEAFTRLWEKRSEMKRIENHKAYAATAVRNIALSMLSANNRTISESLVTIPDHADDSQSPHQHIETRDDLRTVASLLRQLPENQRKVIMMTAAGGLSPSEIKNATGLSEENIRVLLSRGRKRLRSLFSIQNNKTLIN